MLEEEFLSSFHRRQAVADVLVRLLGTGSFAAVALHSWKAGMEETTRYALLIVFFNAMPLLLMLACNKYYWTLRPQIKATMATFGWYFDGLAFNSMAKQVELYGPEALPEQLSRWLLLLTWRPLVFIWANLTHRLPFSMHVLVHGIGMLVELTTISERCRWAPQPWAKDFIGMMRRVLRTSPPAEGSVEASEIGTCSTAMSFLMMTVGFLLPSYIALVLELKARHSFKSRWSSQLQRQARDAPPPARQPPGQWRPEWMSTKSMLWQACLAALVCWRLADKAGSLFPQWGFESNLSDIPHQSCIIESSHV